MSNSARSTGAPAAGAGVARSAQVTVMMPRQSADRRTGSSEAEAVLKRQAIITFATYPLRFSAS